MYSFNYNHAGLPWMNIRKIVVCSLPDEFMTKGGSRQNMTAVKIPIKSVIDGSAGYDMNHIIIIGPDNGLVYPHGNA